MFRIPVATFDTVCVLLPRQRARHVRGAQYGASHWLVAEPRVHPASAVCVRNTQERLHYHNDNHPCHNNHPIPLS